MRARTRDDIEALRDQISTLSPYEDKSADSRWRANVTRAGKGGENVKGISAVELL